MKIKLLLAALFVAGLASALAFAAPTRAGDGTTTTGATTTTAEHHGKGDGEHGKQDKQKPTCQNVELRGTSGSGSVAFTVTKAGDHNSALVGKQVTLTIPAGSTLGALACVDATGAFTLRKVEIQRQKSSTTTTTGTTTTAATTTTTH